MPSPGSASVSRSLARGSSSGRGLAPWGAGPGRGGGAEGGFLRVLGRELNGGAGEPPGPSSAPILVAMETNLLAPANQDAWAQLTSWMGAPGWAGALTQAGGNHEGECGAGDEEGAASSPQSAPVPRTYNHLCPLTSRSGDPCLFLTQLRGDAPPAPKPPTLLPLGGRETPRKGQAFTLPAGGGRVGREGPAVACGAHTQGRAVVMSPTDHPPPSRARVGGRGVSSTGGIQGLDLTGH